MKLIIVRHAKAVERSAGISDANRYLTPEGRSFFRKTACTMRDKGICPDLILASPLLRSVQTADILAETIAYDGPLVVENALAPGFDRNTLKKLVLDHSDARELVIVGHEPDLSEVIVSLLHLPQGFSFKKGTAVKLKIDPDHFGEPGGFKWLAAGGKLLRAQSEAFGGSCI